MFFTSKTDSIHFIFILSFFLLIRTPGCFAAPPDAGQILMEQRQLDREKLEKFEPDLEPGVRRPPLDETGITLVVKEFKPSGDIEIITKKEFLNITGEWLGKEIGFTGIAYVAERLEEFLREKGYLLARVIVPEQDVTDGTIELLIVAGNVEGRINVDMTGPHRIKRNVLDGIAAAVHENEAVRMQKLEKAVLLMNDLPGITAKAYLDKGEKTGARVTIKTEEGPLFNTALSVDNYSGRYTGTWRRLLHASINDPAGIGDRIAASFINAEELNQGAIAYSLPLFSDGTTGKLSFSDLYYEIGDDLADLRVKGKAQTFGLALSKPLIRTRKASIWGNAGAEYLYMEDKANDIVTAHRRIPVGNVSFNGQFFDGFGRGGFTSIELSLYGGRVNLTDGEEDDIAGPNTRGNFFRGTYSIARLQRFMRNISLFGTARGQFSDSNLDSSQKFILGGPTGVRAYPVGEASGDQGHNLTFETRFDVPSPRWARTQLIGFFDAGQIRMHKDTWANSVTNADGKNHYWIYGAGPGLSIEKEDSYSLRFSYAFKIGSNPGRNTNDDDADNRGDKGRFWLQAVVWF